MLKKVGLNVVHFRNEDLNNIKKDVRFWLLLMANIKQTTYNIKFFKK